MRVYLVDDEDHARGLLKRFLSANPEIDIVGEQGDPVAAIEEINRLRPDLVFLDIDMPALTGFEMLPYLKRKPLIIFLTAYDEYAIKAFEVNALDYVLKPPTPERLAESLSRAHDRWSALAELELGDPKPRGLTKIVCGQGSAYRVVWVKDVASFSKDGRYTVLVTRQQKQWFTDLTVDYLEKRLHNPLFFRINRGWIIHKELVSSFDGLPSGQLAVQLSDGQTLNVSRRRSRAFRDWLEMGE